jgi:hypothetical protein
MSHVLLIKRISILMLSFLIMVSAFTNLCLASSSPFPVADQASNLGSQDHSQHDHGQPSHNEKPQCHKGLLCCPAAAQGASSYTFLLDSRPVTSVVISFQPIEITESIYHPPEIRL